MAAGLIAETGMHTGGDTLGNGVSVSAGTETLGAGDGYSVALGYRTEMGKSSDLIISFGMKQEVIYPDSGTIRFARYPLNVLFLFGAGKWQYGPGITYHLNPLYQNETATRQTLSFKDSLGYILEMHYRAFDRVYVAARYTIIDYEVDNVSTGTSIGGDSIGLLIGIKL